MKFKHMLFSMLLAFNFNAFAGGAPPPLVDLTPVTLKSNTNTENRAYAGLVWTLQDKFSFIPDLSFGFRSLRVKSNDNAQGGEISARVKLMGGFAFDSARLSYIGGDRDLLGNIGVGYSYANSSMLGTVGIQGPYTKVGTDIELTGYKFVPYLEVLTLDKPNKVDKTATSPLLTKVP